ncbi:MAG: hypothetical protein AB1411_00605 [Nitrospirota bacterium]
MSASKGTYSKLLRELATLMAAVAGESVTMVKRSAPDQAMKLKKRAEWDVYLEFLKVLFNLADRLSALYIPVKEQPLFMDSLEDAVTAHLKTVLEPALGPDTDFMEVVLTIGQSVAESRERYERFRFLATEDSKVRDEYFKYLSERIAHLLGATGNGMVVSAATLCVSSAIPAMKAVFDGVRGTAEAEPRATAGGDPQAAERTAGAGAESSAGVAAKAANEIKLVSVISTVQGEEVETRWGVHPRFKQDLKPEEARELTRLMNRVTQILGQRYAAVASSAEWSAWNQIGHA